MVIEAIGRRLRLGVVGSGPGSVIGMSIAAELGRTGIMTSLLLLSSSSEIFLAISL
jgi:hypothetical protein